MSDDYEKDENKGILANGKYLIVAVVAVLFFVFFRWKQDIWQLGSVDMIAAFLLLWFLPIAKMAENGFKHYTPKFIARDMHTTTCGPYEIGPYYVFTKGDVNVAPLLIRLHGKDGTVIVPMNLVHPTGQNWVSTGKPRLITADEMPPEIAAEILREKHCHAPYWRIYADESLIESYVGIEHLIYENRKLSKRAKLSDDVSDSALKLKESVTESWARMESTKQETNIDRIKAGLVGGKDEE